MDTKPLTIVLTAITTSAWCAYALIAAKGAELPLLGLLPFSAWNFASHNEGRYLLLLPVLVYLCVPVSAWISNSKKIACYIPIAPFVGVISFVAQFGVAMTAFK